jgi:hypothetical protein
MNVNDALRIHLASVEGGHANFDDTLALVEQHFHYQPTGFHNGPEFNASDENLGACKVFGIAQYCSLNEVDTLTLFAQHYKQVLDNPAGESHGNIRQFISTGWSGIRFENTPLRLRKTPSEPDTREETHT